MGGGGGVGLNGSKIKISHFICCEKEIKEFSFFCRGNRIPIGGDIYIVGSLTNAGLRPELEDDVISGLEVDSLNGVNFFTRLQIKGRIIHS